MKPKHILFACIAALVVLILFNNKEEASFWLFGEIRTSKLLILAIFFILGLVTGGILFRRKGKHPVEYHIVNNTAPAEEDPSLPACGRYISDADRDYLRKD